MTGPDQGTHPSPTWRPRVYGDGPPWPTPPTTRLVHHRVAKDSFLRRSVSGSTMTWSTSSSMVSGCFMQDIGDGDGVSDSGCPTVTFPLTDRADGVLTPHSTTKLDETGLTWSDPLSYPWRCLCLVTWCGCLCHTHGVSEALSLNQMVVPLSLSSLTAAAWRTIRMGDRHDGADGWGREASWRCCVLTLITRTILQIYN